VKRYLKKLTNKDSPGCEGPQLGNVTKGDQQIKINSMEKR